MRYYLYRDIELLKEIYSQFVGVRLDLDVIERIDAKSCFEEESMFAEPETKISEKNNSRIKMGVRNSSSSNTTTINECANISDVKDIYNKRFYHNLIQNLKNNKYKTKGIYVVCGKMNCMRSEYDGLDKFAEVSGIYVWFEQDKMSNDIQIISSIATKIEVIGCIIKEENQDSPKIIKAIAMYIDV